VPLEPLRKAFTAANEDLIVPRHPMEQFEDEMQPYLDDDTLFGNGNTINAADILSV
jgi:hypothetical protein